MYHEHYTWKVGDQIHLLHSFNGCNILLVLIPWCIILDCNSNSWEIQLIYLNSLVIILIDLTESSIDCYVLSIPKSSFCGILLGILNE